MISSYDIKREYIKLYSALRNYLWGYEFVSALVDLEAAVLVRFPDMKKLRSALQSLYNMSAETRKEDEQLQSCFDSFKKLVENSDCSFSYLKLNVKE